MVVVSQGLSMSGGETTGGTTPQVLPVQAYSAFRMDATTRWMFTGLVKNRRAQ
jgi:hypothetical protein